MDSPLLHLQNISFAYEDQPPALEDITLSIYENERIAVLGNNGAGKSTLFLLCNGVLHPAQGRILLRGDEIHYTKKELTKLRQQVGIVFQDPNQQFIGATVEEEISFGPMNLSLAADDVQERVNDALAKMSLAHLRDRPPHYLSGGEKRRLSIADVLAMNPALILMDEPTAFLDASNILRLESMLAQLQLHGKTLMVATHDVDFALRWATRVLILDNGRILADGPPSRILGDPALLDRVQMKQPVFYELLQKLVVHGVLDSEKLPVSVDELVAILAGRHRTDL